MHVIAFDFETTSAKPLTTRVVQTAWIKAKLPELTPESEFNLLSNPEVEIHHEAEAIHGISNHMVKDKPLDYEVVKQLAEFVLHSFADESMLAGHNSTTFDLPILERMSGYSFKDWLHLDTLILAQRTWPEAPNHKLSDLTQWLEIGTGEGAHDALVDIKMVLKLIQALSDHHGKSAEQLAEWCRVPVIQTYCGIGKNKGKPWGQDKGCVPWFFVNWMVNNWESASLDIQATILYHYGKRFRFKGAMRALPFNTEYPK